MSKQPKKHPYAHWRWWQAIGIALFSFGGFGILVGILPPFSSTALKIGLVLAAVATIAAVWNWRSYNWWSRLTVGGLWTLQIMAIAARAFAESLPNLWLWFVPTIGAYLLAWSLPALRPAISSLLWREQTAPQTRWGRAFLGLMIALAPVAGVLGASFGMYGSRFEEIKLTLIALASLASITAIGIAFALAYQLWPERPWAKNEAKETAET
ncbi:MAG: hypothetical protein GTO14_17975 [Anaerolineales bacterium]|nr:hypothetical protein [Anaerolineales bacterium]